MATQSTTGAAGSAAVGGRPHDDRPRHDPGARGAGDGRHRGRRLPPRRSTPSGRSCSWASRSTVRCRSAPASPTRSRPRRRPTRSATSSNGDWGPEVKFDLWLPTASPMTTPELLDAVAEGAEQRDIGTIWVGEHVVLFPEYESRYPYAEDGRIPAPPGSGLLEPMVTLTYLAARTSTVRLGTAMLLLPQRNPVYVAKEVSTLDWLSGGRVDLGIGVGWLKEEFDALNTPVGTPGQAHRRVPRGAAHALGRRHVGVQGRDLRPPRLRDVPQARPAPPPPDPHRRRDPGRAPPGRAAQPGLAHLQPQPRAAGRGAGRARHASRGRRAQPSRPAHHGVPVLQPADARRRRGATPRPAPTPWRRSSSPSPPTTSPGPSTTSRPAGRWPPASAADRPACACIRSLRTARPGAQQSGIDTSNLPAGPLRWSLDGGFWVASRVRRPDRFRRPDAVGHKNQPATGGAKDYGRREVRCVLGAECARFLAPPVGIGMSNLTAGAARANRPQE